MKYLEGTFKSAEYQRGILRELQAELAKKPDKVTARWHQLHMQRLNGISEFIEKQRFIDSLVEGLKEAV